jgi:tetratricopeptide (TPR) repeat protein
VAVYRVLDRIAPAPYVEISLAREALQRGDADAAERYSVRLPGSPIRDELFAAIAIQRGQRVLALEYLFAAPDPGAIDRVAQSLAPRDPVSAYAMERLLTVRLARDGPHPDAVAQTYWEMGRLANRTAWRQVPGGALQRSWLERGLDDFDTAAALAPFSERYLVEAANQADLLGKRERARQLFARAAAIDPASADAVAGLGVIAWQSGDRRAAVTYLQRARRLDPHALMVRALEGDVRN